MSKQGQYLGQSLGKHLGDASTMLMFWSQDVGHNLGGEIMWILNQEMCKKPLILWRIVPRSQPDVEA